MSDKEDNIFADSDDDGNESDDTAELFAQSGNKKKAAAAAAPAKKKKDEGDDLFDSDSEDEESKPKAASSNKKKPMSKREKLEALAKKKRQDEGSPATKKSSSSEGHKKKEPEDKDSSKQEKKDGYESENSVDSAQFERTAEDDAFIDTTGEDDEAVKELYAKQHFEEEDDDMEDNGVKKKRKYRHDEAIEDGKEPDNPLDAAMMRMKRKKREKKSTLEIEDEIKEFLGKMEEAAEQDEQAVAQRRPGMKKLGMLNQVLDTIKNQDYQSALIDGDLLTVVRRWIQPLPNGQLGNVTVRQKLLDAIANMPGIHPNALKRSELGKTVMLLHKHPKETPSMKRQTRELIEQWSRGIFQKSGDMRMLDQVHQTREGSLAAIRRQQAATSTANAAARRDRPGDLKSIIASGKRGGEALAASANRVRVPFSKGFAYSVRPVAKGVDPTETRRSPAKESRGGLAKRMLEKSKKVGKNQRSANISIEGRRTKG